LDTFLKRVKRTIDRDHLLEKGDRLIVGVSAGIDSMVLLHVLNACRQDFELSLIVAHVNHGFRPAEAEKEAQLVRRASERLGLPFEYGQFCVKEFQKAQGLSPQDAARRLRFRFFSDLLQKHRADKIALGHHADDQVETVLLRLLRGCGLQGLTGMKSIRQGKVIRPLLERWKEEIESFARENEIPYLQDASNLKGGYLRNRIRLELIPSIEAEYQSNVKAVLLKTSAILREEDDYLEREAEKAYQEIVHEEQGGFVCNLPAFQSLHRSIQRRILQKMLGRVDGEEGEWLDVDPIRRRMIQSSPSFLQELPQGLLFERRYDAVFLKKGRVEPNRPFDVILRCPGRTLLGEIGREVVVDEIEGSDLLEGLEGSPNIALMDRQTLQFPLKMRNFMPGDRFQPLGLKGTEKLKKFFIDHKVPRQDRMKVPLLISGERIAWVAGYRVDERVKVTGKTRRILKVSLLP
jgi:tRNA(Ile)-lysidine synthase